MAKKPKRPRDVNQLAKMIVDIASEEDVAKEKKKPRQKIAGPKLQKAKI